MIHAILPWTLFIAVLAVLAGCAAPAKNNEFADVQKSVQQRSGQRVQWRGHSADDSAIYRAVGELLDKPLSVDDAVQIALLNNLDLQASFENLGIAQSDLVQAGLLSNPTFYAERRVPGQAAEFDVAQNFLDLLIIPMRKKVAAADLESVRQRLTHEVLSLRTQVESAYYTFQAREQLVDRLKLIAELNRTAADLSCKQQQAGTTNELNAANQQVLYEQSQADVTSAQAQLVADREQLNRLMGLWGSQIHWTIPSKLPPIPTTEPSMDHLESLALSRRADLSERRSQIESAARALGIVDAFRYIPVLTISGHYEHEDGPSRSAGPAVEIGVPLFDHGQAARDRGQSVLAQARRRYMALAIDIRSQVREALGRMKSQRKLLEQYRAMLPQRQRILQLSLEQYNGMLGSPYDLLLARQNEADAEQKLIDAWRDYWIQHAELEQATGGRLR